MFRLTALTLGRSVRLGPFGTGIPELGLKALDLVAECRFDVPIFLGRSQRDLLAVYHLGFRAGFDAFLVGERLMTAPDPGVALAALLNPAGGGA